MNNSFFASVRRNQKQWMVVVTVLSMVSFLFLDDFGRGNGPMSPLGGGLMIGCLVAAGMSIIGYPRGLTAEFGAGGFIVGFLAGYLGFGAVGAAKPLVSTGVGNFSRMDLDRLSMQRQKLNQFAFAVARKRQNQQASGFGNVDDPSIVMHQMVLADAKKMGIQVSDERVNDFLKQMTQGQLSKQDFKDCLRESRMGEGELFELLKDELSIQLYRGLAEPPSYMPPIIPGLMQMLQQQRQTPPRYMQPTPHQLWTDYQKLTLKQKLQAVALPVRDFVSKVTEPSDVEVVAFFEQHASKYWTDEARPGFIKPATVQLAYLTADFEKFEKGTDPTDAEVAEYFEKNKEKYRVLPEKESASIQLPDAQVEQTKPATTTEETPKAEDAAKPNEEVKKESEPPTKPVEEEPKSKCGGDETEKAAAAKAEPAAEQKAEPAKTGPAAEKPATPAAAKTEESPDTKPKANEAAAETSLPALSSSPESLPGPKYRELNDELKLEIREAILRERAFELITLELDKAHDYMIKLGLDYDTTIDPEKKADKAKAVTEQLKEYAQAHKLEFKETADLSYEDLLSQPIGSAIEGKGRSPVVEEVFARVDNGEARIPLFSPRRADSKPSNEAFAYWKTAQRPDQMSDIKDEAVRAKVISAWKFDQARSIAEKRAREMVAKVKAEGNDLPAALAAETVTGDKEAPVISVIPTDDFTWLSTKNSVPGNPSPPSISIIPLLDDIGEKFMQTVFDELNDGDVGFATDEPRSVLYVVKVLNRETGNDDQGGVVKHEKQQNFLKTEFAPSLFPYLISPYQFLAMYPQQQIETAWSRNFEQQHSVEWNDEAGAARNSRPMRRRR